MIDTGIPGVTLAENAPAGRTFIDKVILPPEEGMVEPGSFLVTEGYAAVVTAYGLQDGEELTFEKMLLTSGTPGGASACGCPAQLGTIAARISGVALCNFSLDKCHAIRVISIPGRYRVVDPLQLTENSVIVTLDLIKNTGIPSNLLFGGTP